MRKWLDLVTRSSFVSTQNRRPRDPYSNQHKSKAVCFLISHKIYSQAHYFAEMVGFEPTDGLLRRLFSKQVP